MNPPPSSQNDGRRTRRVWPVIAGVIVFGALMGLRPEFTSIWGRMLMAVCAFAALGMGLAACLLHRPG